MNLNTNERKKINKIPMNNKKAKKNKENKNKDDNKENNYILKITQNKEKFIQTNQNINDKKHENLKMNSNEKYNINKKNIRNLYKEKKLNNLSYNKKLEIKSVIDSKHKVLSNKNTINKKESKILISADSKKKVKHK